MNVLVTGGLGYIGSHVIVELLNNNHNVISINHMNPNKFEIIKNIETITNKTFKAYFGDAGDYYLLNQIFHENKIDVVIHLAGYKAVRESIEKPMMYYYNNLASTIVLLDVMKKYNVKKLIFSSSATVYGERKAKKYKETMGRGKTTNPYGTTKAIIEQILEDLYTSDNEWSISILRYFNPIGAHESGLIGENPDGIPSNLMPYLVKVAKGEIENLNVFGDDYPTIDGTCVRDYTHVVDLAKGHIVNLSKMNETGIRIYNLGTGKGTSVLELINAFEKVNNVKINYKIIERRVGDLAEVCADTSKIYKELGWKAEKTLEDMCKDSWNFINKVG